MTIDDQTVVPDSFRDLYRDAFGRLTETPKVIARRSEFCEDLACVLTDQVSAIHFRDGVDENEVLERCHKGLLASPATVTPLEAAWVVHRTAELLRWSWNGVDAPLGE